MNRMFQLLFGLFISLTSLSQGTQFFTIGTEEFSNVNIYSLLYDDVTDILHAGTNRGIFSYKQNTFIPVSSCEEQVGNSLFQLKKDKEGRIFCCNLIGQIFQIEDNQLKLFYQIPKGDSKVDFRYHFDEENNLIVHTFTLIIRVNTQGEETVLLNNEMLAKYNATGNEIGKIVASSIINGTIYFRLSNKKLYLTYKNGKLQKHSLLDEDSSYDIDFFQFGNYVCYLSKGRIKAIDGGLLEANLDIEQQSDIYQLTKNKIAVRNTEHGFLYTIEYDGEKFEKKNVINDYFASCITMNHNNTLFVGTFNEGVIVVPNEEITKFSADNPLVGIASSDNNEVYISNLRKGIFKHDTLKTKVQNPGQNLDNIFYLNNEYPFFNGFISGIVLANEEENEHYPLFSNIKDLEEISDEKVLFITPENINIIMKDSDKILKPDFARQINDNVYKIDLKNRGKSVTYLNATNRLYYSTSIDVYSRVWNEPNVDLLSFEGESILGNDLTYYNDQLIIGSGNHGLLFYHEDKFQKQVSQKNGLSSNKVLKIKVKDEFLVIITTKGLQIYDLVGQHFLFIGEAEGVIRNKVINFAISQDRIWLLERYGYYSIPLNQRERQNENSNVEEVLIDSILVNGIRVPLKSKQHLEYNQNRIEIYFDYRDIETKKEAILNFKLEGYENTWQTVSTSENRIEFPFLPPGEYGFLMKASYRERESETFNFQFEISKPIWLKIWFLAICVFVIVLLTSLFFMRRISINKKKRRVEVQQQKMKMEMLESKLKTIRSQMNPHFIFNSLNSIQALVLDQDVKRSYDYIEMFGRLVRNVLRFSEQNNININDEVDFLTVYLELESLRMKEDFEFSITNNIDEEVRIPTLLIQPFIENAMHHGLLNKEGQKKLSIEFQLIKDSIQCVILDNGIGRKRSREVNKRQNRPDSFSLNAIEDRLRLLSEHSNCEFKYEIEDLYSADEKAAGTKVTVIFPFQIDY
ncbi:MAG: hypothetical protein GQ574_28175 [Crocinitomix sp.]|nr:hypothetical protein [Crocinitomix sp.]